MAACIPTLRPGYKWLTQRMSAVRPSRDHYKLSDNVRLKPVAEPPSTQRTAPISYGNDTSVDVEYGSQALPNDRIRKPTGVFVDYSGPRV